LLVQINCPDQYEGKDPPRNDRYLTGPKLKTDRELLPEVLDIPQILRCPSYLTIVQILCT